MYAIKVIGNNEGLYTEKAYQELRLQMSTGDFHTHKTEEVNVTGDDYDQVIHIDDLVEDACRICERIGCGATIDDEYSFKQCDDCRLRHVFHGERYQVGRELDSVRKEYLDRLTWKQFNAVGSEHIECASKSKKTLSLHRKMLQLMAIYCAYSDAIGDLK